MQITRHVLRSGDVSASILNLGCILQDWRVPLGQTRIPVVLGHDDPQAYQTNPNYMGAVVGRVANRIAGARFTLDGETYVLPANEPPHHLHGGPDGLHNRIWSVERDGDSALRLGLTSEHLDQGYPGLLEISVIIRLTGAELCYEFTATTDRPTPINLSQHAYYNLMGRGTVADHRLRISAETITPTCDDQIPTGQITPVDDTNDFRTPRAIGTTPRDVNLMLTGTNPAAELTAPNGLKLSLDTDKPGLQLYTGHHLPTPFAGLCLEPQFPPNAINMPAFAMPLTTPDQPYRHRLSLRITAP